MDDCIKWHLVQCNKLHRLLHIDVLSLNYKAIKQFLSRMMCIITLQQSAERHRKKKIQKSSTCTTCCSNCFGFFYEVTHGKTASTKEKQVLRIKIITYDNIIVTKNSKNHCKSLSIIYSSVYKYYWSNKIHHPTLKKKLYTLSRLLLRLRGNHLCNGMQHLISEIQGRIIDYLSRSDTKEHLVPEKKRKTGSFVTHFLWRFSLLQLWIRPIFDTETQPTSHSVSGREKKVMHTIHISSCFLSCVGLHCTWRRVDSKRSIVVYFYINIRCDTWKTSIMNVLMASSFIIP